MQQLRPWSAHSQETLTGRCSGSSSPGLPISGRHKLQPEANLGLKRGSTSHLSRDLGQVALLNSLDLSFPICKIRKSSGQGCVHSPWNEGPAPVPTLRGQEGAGPASPLFCNMCLLTGQFKGWKIVLALQPTWADSHSALGWGPCELPTVSLGPKGRPGPGSRSRRGSMVSHALPAPESSPENVPQAPTRPGPLAECHFPLPPGSPALLPAQGAAALTTALLAVS